MANEDHPSKKDEAEMTPEERLAWLRDRGVMVETAEERKRKQVADVIQNSGDRRVYYVHVPADTSKPMEELSYVLPPKPTADHLLEHLQPAFQQGEAKVDIDLLKEQQPTLLASGGNGTALPVSDATLRSVAKQAHIETFSLVHPTPSNKFAGVNIYLDEVGMLKRLPLNTRASRLAGRAGYEPPPTFYGDVFVGRTHNTSMQVREVAGDDISWLQQAAADNIAFQQQQRGATMQQQDLQPSMPGSEGRAKEEEGYSWTQTQEEVELYIALPDTILKAKQLKVIPKPQNLQVLGDSNAILQLPLFENVDVDSCTWTLESTDTDAKKLVISLEKVEEAFWPRIRD